MRLTCPNCGAQYEVPDEVIPEGGRDVQCSNCGDTWFQHHPNHAPDEIEDAEAEDIGWETPPDPEAPFERPQPDGDEGSDAEPADGQPDDHDENTKPDTPERRELDPAVADVLREEAEREQAARASENSLETQPDLGLDDTLDDAEKRQAEAQARMARLRGEPEEAETAEPDPGTRRNLLPDIDEINSSLSSDASDPGTVHPGDTDDMDVSPKSSGFRRGFLTMILLAVIGLLLYMFAPQLAEAVPALKGTLTGYVEMINGLRGWLDQTVGGAATTLDGMSSEEN